MRGGHGQRRQACARYGTVPDRLSGQPDACSQHRPQLPDDGRAEVIFYMDGTEGSGPILSAVREGLDGLKALMDAGPLTISEEETEDDEAEESEASEDETEDSEEDASDEEEVEAEKETEDKKEEEPKEEEKEESEEKDDKKEE